MQNLKTLKEELQKERIDLYKKRSEDTLVTLLPILDDFERAIKAKSDSQEEQKEDEGVY